MICCHGIFDLIVFRMRCKESLHSELRLQGLCLLLISQQSGYFEAVSSRMVQQAAQKGASDISCKTVECDAVSSFQNTYQSRR